MHASRFTLTEVNRVRRRLRAATLVVAASVLVVAAPACSGSGATADPPSTSTARSSGTTAGTTAGTRPGTTAPRPTSTTAPATTAIASGDEAQIRQLIDTYWEEWKVVGNPPDLERTSFFGLLTGHALERAIDSYQTAAQASQAIKLPEPSVFRHSIERIDLSGDQAKVFECVVDDAVVFDQRDGRILNNAVATSLFETNVVRTGGRWLISDGATIDEKDGVQPCAEA